MNYQVNTSCIRRTAARSSWKMFR